MSSTQKFCARSMEPGHSWAHLAWSLRSDFVVILILTSPVHDGTNIQTLHPCVSRTIVEDAKVSSIPWQRTGESKSRWQEFAGDAHAFRVGTSLELSTGEPGAINRGR